MDAVLSGNGKREGLAYSEVREAKTDGLKDLLVGLIDSSKALDVRVWLDGVYTDIGDEIVDELDGFVQSLQRVGADYNIIVMVEGRAPRQLHSAYHARVTEAKIAREGPGA